MTESLKSNSENPNSKKNNSSTSQKEIGSKYPKVSEKLKRNVLIALISAGFGVGTLVTKSFSLYSEYMTQTGKINVNNIKQNSNKNSDYRVETIPFEEDKDIEKRLEPKVYTPTLVRSIDGKQVKTPSKIKHFKNNVNRYYDTESGRELYLLCNKDMTSCRVANEQPLSNARHIQGIVPNKSQKVSIVACSNSNVHQAIQSNAKHGWETLAIVGTGTVTDTAAFKKKIIDSNKSNDPFSFPDSSGKPKSPAGDQFVRFPDGSTLKTGLLELYTKYKRNIPTRDAGFVTYKDGTTKLVDLTELNKPQALERIKSLEKDPNVASFSITGWIAKPQKRRSS